MCPDIKVRRSVSWSQVVNSTVCVDLLRFTERDLYRYYGKFTITNRVYDAQLKDTSSSSYITLSADVIDVVRGQQARSWHLKS